MVKLHAFGEVMATPPALLAVTLTSYLVDPASAAAGVKVAFRSVALYVVAPVTVAPAEVLTVKASVLWVIALSKVAVTVLLVATPVA